MQANQKNKDPGISKNSKLASSGGKGKEELKVYNNNAFSPNSSTKSKASTDFDDRFLQKEYQDYFEGKGSRPKPHPQKDHELNIKMWDFDFKNWVNGEGEKPGPHPIDNHDWNMKPEIYNDIV